MEESLQRIQNYSQEEAKRWISNSSGGYIGIENSGWVFIENKEIAKECEGGNFQGVVGRVNEEMDKETEHGQPVVDKNIQMTDIIPNASPTKIPKQVLPFLSLPIVAMIQFIGESVVGILQYMAVSIEMSDDWKGYIFDIFDGLEVIVVNIDGTAYIVITIILICFILGLAILMVLVMLDIVDADWFEACDEVVFIIIYEYVFFGFFAIPIMKMFLQTYD
jgi:hypothetical protein